MDYKILIADFDPKSLEELKNFFPQGDEYDNYTLLSATDGKELFDQLEQSPDIILLNSPEITDGLEIIQALRENQNSRYTPILFILEDNQTDGIESIFQFGIIDFVFRPLKKDELILRTRSVLFKNSFFQRFMNQAEQLELLATVASKSSNSVAIINPDGKIIWVNEGFENMYECTLDEFIELFDQTLLNPDHNTLFNQSIAKSIEERINVVYENHWFTRSGKEKWIQTTITPIINERTGHVSRLIAIETDVTNLKKAEARLEEQNKYLLKVTRHLETTNEILEKQRVEIEKERQKADDLLFNTFPYTIAKQLKSKGEARLKRYKLVTVLFTDFKGFTTLSEQLDIEDLIKQLSNYFERFEEIIIPHYVEKIKTIGDSFMCAGGLPLSNKSNPIDVALCGLEIQEFVRQQNEILKAENRPLWELRLGIHTGEVIAGIIGKKKFAYDTWGDTVNTASRMETSAEPGKVNISGDTYKHIKDFFDCTYRGKISVKYKGEMEMYFINRLKPEYSADEKGIFPNEEFSRILSTY